MERSEVAFISHGTRCAAWLYRPPGSGPFPCVVLAHGLGATRDMGLDVYARRFVAAGLTALVFDYRHFGASDGQPRQLLDIRCQLDDWTAAVAYARTLDEVDPARIALWGSSFSGGHALVTAAHDERIAAVVAQIPHTDGLTTLTQPTPLGTLRVTLAAMRDMLHHVLRKPPYTVPVAGKPGTAAALATPGALEAYQAFAPPERWNDRISARVLLRVPLYRPIAFASRIHCPTLLCVCEQDRITSPQAAQRVARLIRRSEVRSFPGDHFAIYMGETFEVAVMAQCEFLKQHLLASS